MINKTIHRKQNSEQLESYKNRAKKEDCFPLIVLYKAEIVTKTIVLRVRTIELCYNYSDIWPRFMRC